MLAKYKIEFGVQFQRHNPSFHYETDDPIVCEEFLSGLLENDFPIHDIKHDGVSLPKIDFDKMIKTAANILASKHICNCLNIKGEEERFRFGFAA